MMRREQSEGSIKNLSEFCDSSRDSISTSPSHLFVQQHKRDLKKGTKTIHKWNSLNPRETFSTESALSNTITTTDKLGQSLDIDIRTKSNSHVDAPRTECLTIEDYEKNENLLNSSKYRSTTASEVIKKVSKTFLMPSESENTEVDLSSKTRMKKRFKKCDLDVASNLSSNYSALPKKHSLTTDSNTTKNSLSKEENVESKLHFFMNKTLTEPLSADKLYHYAAIGRNFVEMWKSNVLTDICIAVPERSIRMHKVMLACFSDYLKELFVESSTNNPDFILTLNDISLVGLIEFVKYTYVGDIDITLDNVEDVLAAALKLKVNHIIKYSEKFIESLADSPVLLPTYEAWKKAHKLEASNRLFTVIKKKFSEVVSNEQFLSWDVDLVQELISADDIVLKSEAEVYKCILYWIDYNRSSRLFFAPRLMECIRFHLMTFEDIYACLREGSYLMQEGKCRDLLLTGFLHHYCVNNGKPTLQEIQNRNLSSRLFLLQSGGSPPDISFENNSTMPYVQRNFLMTPPKLPANSIATVESKSRVINQSTTNISSRANTDRSKHTTHYVRPDSPLSASTIAGQNYYLTILGGMDPTSQRSSYAGKICFRYNLRSKTWERMASLPIPKAYHAAAYIDGYVYVGGGCDPTYCKSGQLTATNSLFSFSLQQDRWEILPSMRHKRMHHALCATGSLLYAIGGLDEKNKVMSSVECYYPKQKAWKAVATMNIARMGVAAASHNSLIYVVGGIGERSAVLPNVEYYDPEKNIWTNLKHITIPRCHAGLVEVCNVLCIVGGASKTSDKQSASLSSLAGLEQYDPVTDSWSYKSSLEYPRHAAGVVVVGSRIYVYGGVNADGNCVVTSMECYDFLEDKWAQDVDDIPQGTIGFRGCFIPPSANSSLTI